MKLEYTTDGSTWNVIADSIPATDGGYTWQVPASATTTARVRVSDASEAAVADTSDADFAITSAPSQDPRAAITQETEANNSAATASGRVGADKNVSGALSSSSDVDWFAFNVTTAGSVKVMLSMPGAQDLDWYVYSASDLLFSAASSATMSNPEVGTFSANAPGIYYVKVVGYAGATGAYTLTVSGAGVQP
ncbi:PPC domain-containing protein [Cystobacter fuscus]